VETFSGKLWDELLSGEPFQSLPEARYVLDAWRTEYNHERPHSGLKWHTAGAFAPSLAGSPVGAPPLPAAQPTPTDSLTTPGTRTGEWSQPPQRIKNDVSRSAPRHTRVSGGQGCMSCATFSHSFTGLERMTQTRTDPSAHQRARNDCQKQSVHYTQGGAGPHEGDLE